MRMSTLTEVETEPTQGQEGVDGGVKTAAPKAKARALEENETVEGHPRDWGTTNGRAAWERHCPQEEAREICNHGKGKDVALPLAPMRWLFMCTSSSNARAFLYFFSKLKHIMDVKQTLAQIISITVTLLSYNSCGAQKIIMSLAKAAGGITALPLQSTMP